MNQFNYSLKLKKKKKKRFYFFRKPEVFYEKSILGPWYWFAPEIKLSLHLFLAYEIHTINITNKEGQTNNMSITKKGKKQQKASFLHFNQKWTISAHLLKPIHLFCCYIYSYMSVCVCMCFSKEKYIVWQEYYRKAAQKTTQTKSKVINITKAFPTN